MKTNLPPKHDDSCRESYRAFKIARENLIQAQASCPCCVVNREVKKMSLAHSSKKTP